MPCGTLRIAKTLAPIKKLIQTNKNISEIIYESGFQSQTHFNKLFVKTNQMKPLAYRMKYRK